MNYVVQDTSLTAVADAIRKQTKSTEQIPFPNGFVSEIEKIDVESSYNNGYQQGYTEGEAKGEEQGYDRGYGEGQKAEYDKFWDNYQQNGERADYRHAFGGSGWDDTNFKPKYNIVTNNQPFCMFIYSGITDLKGILEDLGITIDFGEGQNMTNLFAYSKITRCPPVDVRSAIYPDAMFYKATELEEVTLLNVRKEKPAAMFGFTGCAKLKTLIVTGVIGGADLKDCPLLSNESVQGIIDILYDYTNETAKTLTLHVDVKAKLTEAQIAQITSKNWNLA